jgi:hypothetical protein
MAQPTVRKRYKYKLMPTAEQEWELGRVLGVLGVCRALYKRAANGRTFITRRRLPLCAPMR